MKSTFAIAILAASAVAIKLTEDMPTKLEAKDFAKKIELAQEETPEDDEEATVKYFIDELWFHGDANEDGTLDEDEGRAALEWFVGEDHMNEEEAMAIFEHVGDFAGEDEVVSKEEMFEAAKAAAEEHPESAEELYRGIKDFVEADEADEADEANE